jgi:hypothetical protein
VEPSMSVKRSVSVSIAKAYEGTHLPAATSGAAHRTLGVYGRIAMRRHTNFQ